MHEIEVIIKTPDKVYKLVNITRSEFDSMKRKSGVTYQAFQLGFSKYKEASEMAKLLDKDLYTGS